MKKIAVISTGGLAIAALAGVILFRTMEAKEVQGGQDVSARSAKSLQQKIDAIKNAESNPNHKRGSSRIEISESELESYLLTSLKDDIPAQIDSADVQLGQDTVALDTQITFNSGATSNPIVDTLIGGTHNLFLKGKLVARDARGKFELQDVKVDGIPMPNVLIQTLFKKYVKPKYPDADLDEPFDLPWGMREIKVQPGKATVVY